MRNEEILTQNKVGQEYPAYKKGKKAKLICNIRFLKHVTEGKIHGRIEVHGIRGKGLRSYSVPLRKIVNTGN